MRSLCSRPLSEHSQFSPNWIVNKMGRFSVQISLVCVLLSSLLGAASPQPLPDLETSGDGSGTFDGSGSGGRGDLGSGDGSGGDVEPEPRCRRPSTPILPLPTSREEPLLTEIRCHLACVQRVSQV